MKDIIIHVFSTPVQSARDVRQSQDMLQGLSCGIYIDVRAKRNRRIRLFEKRSIRFLIIERFEFLIRRFYNVCDDVYLMLLKSSRHVSFDGHPSRTVQSVKETRNIFSAADSKILEFCSKRF